MIWLGYNCLSKIEIRRLILLIRRERCDVEAAACVHGSGSGNYPGIIFSFLSSSLDWSARGFCKSPATTSGRAGFCICTGLHQRHEVVTEMVTRGGDKMDGYRSGEVTMTPPSHPHHTCNYFDKRHCMHIRSAVMQHLPSFVWDSRE